MYYVYVLEIRSDLEEKLYVGYCRDLRKRVDDHLNRSTKTTKNYQKIKLIYYEACLNKTDAIKREYQLKTGFGRGYLKRRLINYISMRD